MAGWNVNMFYIIPLQDMIAYRTKGKVEVPVAAPPPEEDDDDDDDDEGDDDDDDDDDDE